MAIIKNLALGGGIKFCLRKHLQIAHIRSFQKWGHVYLIRLSFKRRITASSKLFVAD